VTERPRHETVSALLGVWAIGACSAEEAEAVMEHLPHCESCSAEAARLSGAADLLGAAAPPPARLRGRVLERARLLRPAASPCPGYAEAYAAQVSVLDSLLRELDGPEWTVNVIYDWNVQDVVAHLAATDGLVAAQLDVPVDPPLSAGAPANGSGTPGGGSAVPGADVAAVIEGRTAVVIGHERARPPESTRTAWRVQADALCRGLPADSSHRLTGVPLRIADAVVARAFETWVHSDDIATAVGRRLPPPLPRHLYPIAALGVRSLPRALGRTWGERPSVAAQVVLDGPGGGQWVVGLGARPPADSTPVVRLEMDVIEFCFLAGGRRDPATVGAVVTGDEELGRELLAAAPAFAGP
jgi:uncharacterized protein (TIGR03083 family)